MVYTNNEYKINGGGERPFAGGRMGVVTGDCGARAGVGMLSFCNFTVKIGSGMTHP